MGLPWFGCLAHVVRLYNVRLPCSKGLLIECCKTLAVIHITIENGPDLCSFVIYKNLGVAAFGEEELHFLERLSSRFL